MNAAFKILYYTAFSQEQIPAQGGAIVVAWDTVAQLEQLGHTVDRLYYQGELYQSPLTLQTADGECHSYPHLSDALKHRPYTHLWGNQIFQDRDYSHIASSGITLIHEMHSADYYPAKWSQRIALKPYHKHWRKFLNERRHARACQFAQQIIVPSHFAKTALSNNYGVSTAKVQAIYNSVDTDLFSPLGDQPNSETLTLFNAGRIIPERNFLGCIRIYHELTRAFPNLALRLAGDGIQRAECEAYVQEHEIPNVTFLGAITPSVMASEYQRADLLLNTSLAESFGCVIAEAMSCGLPIVAYRVGALPELIENGRTGYLVNKNDEQALTKHAHQLLSNPEQRQALSSASREQAIEFFSVTHRVKSLSRI